MLSKKSVAVFGLGKIGILYDLNNDETWKTKQVMTHVRAVLESPLFEIKYLVDENPNVIEVVKSIFPNVTCSTLNIALEQTSPDLVVIATPTNSHLEVIHKISKKWIGCNYLIEKPVGINSSEASAILEILMQQNRLISVNYFRRFLPNFNELRTLPLFRTRGTLKSISISAYGSLINIFSHFFDTALYLEGRYALGLGDKKIISKQKEYFSFIEINSKVLFNINGIGLDKRECFMEIEYDNITINVIKNGQSIQIYDKNRDLTHILDIGFEKFNQYQSFVLSRIYNQSEFAKNSNIDDAIHIHKFIESIQLINDRE